MSLDARDYREAFHREATALAIAAHSEPQTPIPSCPGWNMPMLLSHLAGIYASRITLVQREAPALIDVRIRDMRVHSIVPISSLPRMSAVRRRFGLLHGVSSLLLLGQILTAGVAIAVSESDTEP